MFFDMPASPKGGIVGPKDLHEERSLLPVGPQFQYRIESTASLFAMPAHPL
jgi:hypothetical protein